MKIKKFLPVALLTLLSVSTIAAPITNLATQATSPNTQVNLYTEDKTNIVITAKQPQFTLRLKSNPTTGFAWFLREYDHNIITPVKHNYVTTKTGLIGASGFEDWVFKVKPTGFVVPQETTIRLFYARPWENTDNGTMAVFRIVTQPTS